MPDEETSYPATPMNEVTRQLCAAAHLRHNAIYRPLEARFEDLRADTPEYFVGMESIHREAEIAHKREIIRWWCLAVTVIAASFAIVNMGYTELLVPVSCVLVLLGVIEFAFELDRQKYVRSRFLAEGGSPGEFKIVNSGATQNVVISGGLSPFVGSGYNVFSWSFVVNLAKSSSEKAPQPLTPTDLYKEVTDSLGELNIPRLVVSDKLFVHGEKLRESKVILPNSLVTPQTQVSEEVVQQEVGKMQDHLRHYRVLQIPTWRGQLILSLFLRFTVIGQALFVEVRLFTLPPLLSKFRAVDNLTKSITGWQLRDIILMSAIKAPFTWFEAGLAGLGASFRFLWPKINDQREEAEDNECYNYGWSKSLREEWSGDSYEDYFQMLDKDMYSKILHSRIIDAIVSALENRGISTEVIKEQRTIILNHGIIGNVQAENMAVGQNSMAASGQQEFRVGAKGSRSVGGGKKS